MDWDLVRNIGTVTLPVLGALYKFTRSSIERQIKTAIAIERVENKVDENTSRTNDGARDIRDDIQHLRGEVGTHQAEDKAMFERIDKRLEYLERRSV